MRATSHNTAHGTNTFSSNDAAKRMNQMMEMVMVAS